MNAWRVQATLGGQTQAEAFLSRWQWRRTQHVWGTCVMSPLPPVFSVLLVPVDWCALSYGRCPIRGERMAIGKAPHLFFLSGPAQRLTHTQEQAAVATRISRALHMRSQHGPAGDLLG